MEVSVIQQIVQLGIEREELRDEILVQCMRQLTRNPHPEQVNFYFTEKFFFSYAGHGRTVAFIFSIDIQQFSTITILTIIQYLPYDYNIVLGGHLRHYINICCTLLNSHLLKRRHS
jgi:hypothetical protein